jgi:hypothetical protein
MQESNPNLRNRHNHGIFKPAQENKDSNDCVMQIYYKDAYNYSIFFDMVVYNLSDFKYLKFAKIGQSLFEVGCSDDFNYFKDEKNFFPIYHQDEKSVIDRIKSLEESGYKENCIRNVKGAQVEIFIKKINSYTNVSLTELIKIVQDELKKILNINIELQGPEKGIIERGLRTVLGFNN